MFDCCNRNINYLRISITDRCNLRCTYCMPPEGISLIRHDDILRFEEILEVVRESVSTGIHKVRITGGEPLVRRGVEELVAMIAPTPGVQDFGMTTNGILLAEFAGKLKKAGLHRVNISLDTVDPARFSQITRGGDVSKVFEGIRAARVAGLDPVKINCVVEQSSAEEDARGVREFCREQRLEVRFIRRMHLESGCFSIVEGGDGGNCGKCGRLRLTANGKIKPCLFSDLEFDIRKLGIREAILQAIKQKPEKGTVNSSNLFHNIGG